MKHKGLTSLTLKFAMMVLLSAPFFAACGGGGDDEDFAFNACEAVGLKVASGVECTIGDNPVGSSIVRLDILDPLGETGVCTGVAIDQYSVLTASHCFLFEYASVDVSTFAGSQRASRVVLHPGFSVDLFFQQAGAVVNDAALVFVDAPLGVASSPLLLSRSPVVGEEAVVSGFGNDRPSGGSGIMRAGNAVVASVTGQHVVIEYKNSQSHPCPGDSGGPLLVQQGGVFAVVGVVSQSDLSVPPNRVCRKGDITLYASIQDPSILSFIQQYVPNAGGV